MRAYKHTHSINNEDKPLTLSLSVQLSSAQLSSAQLLSPSPTILFSLPLSAKPPA